MIPGGVIGGNEALTAETAYATGNTEMQMRSSAAGGSSSSRGSSTSSFGLEPGRMSSSSHGVRRHGTRNLIQYDATKSRNANRVGCFGLCSDRRGSNAAANGNQSKRMVSNDFGSNPEEEEESSGKSRTSSRSSTSSSRTSTRNSASMENVNRLELDAQQSAGGAREVYGQRGYGESAAAVNLAVSPLAMTNYETGNPREQSVSLMGGEQLSSAAQAVTNMLSGENIALEAGAAPEFSGHHRRHKHHHRHGSSKNGKHSHHSHSRSRSRSHSHNRTNRPQNVYDPAAEVRSRSCNTFGTTTSTTGGVNPRSRSADTGAHLQYMTSSSSVAPHAQVNHNPMMLGTVSVTNSMPGVSMGTNLMGPSASVTMGGTTTNVTRATTPIPVAYNLGYTELAPPAIISTGVAIQQQLEQRTPNQMLSVPLSRRPKPSAQSVFVHTSQQFFNTEPEWTTTTSTSPSNGLPLGAPPNAVAAQRLDVHLVDAMPQLVSPVGPATTTTLQEETTTAFTMPPSSRSQAVTTSVSETSRISRPLVEKPLPSMNTNATTTFTPTSNINLNFNSMNRVLSLDASSSSNNNINSPISFIRPSQGTMVATNTTTQMPQVTTTSSEWRANSTPAVIIAPQTTTTTSTVTNGLTASTTPAMASTIGTTGAYAAGTTTTYQNSSPSAMLQDAGSTTNYMTVNTTPVSNVGSASMLQMGSNSMQMGSASMQMGSMQMGSMQMGASSATHMGTSSLVSRGEPKLLEQRTVGETVTQLDGASSFSLSGYFKDQTVMHDDEGEYLVNYVQVPVVQENVRQVAVKQYVERVVEKKTPQFVYTEKLVDVPQVQYVDKPVYVEKVEETIRHVTKKQVVDVIKEITREVKVQQHTTVEKIVEVPGEIIEVPKPYIEEKTVQVPVYQDSLQPTVVSQSYYPMVVEPPEDDVTAYVEVECKQYNFVPVPVDIYIPLPVPTALMFHRLTVEHKLVPLQLIPVEQQNALIKALNPELNLDDALELFTLLPPHAQPPPPPRNAEEGGEGLWISLDQVGTLPLAAGAGTSAVEVDQDLIVEKNIEAYCEAANIDIEEYREYIEEQRRNRMVTLGTTSSAQITGFVRGPNNHIKVDNSAGAKLKIGNISRNASTTNRSTSAASTATTAAFGNISAFSTTPMLSASSRKTSAVNRGTLLTGAFPLAQPMQHGYAHSAMMGQRASIPATRSQGYSFATTTHNKMTSPTSLYQQPQLNIQLNGNSLNTNNNGGLASKLNKMMAMGKNNATINALMTTAGSLASRMRE